MRYGLASCVIAAGLLGSGSLASADVFIEDFDPTNSGGVFLSGSGEGVTHTVGNFDADVDNELRASDTNGGYQPVFGFGLDRGGATANAISTGTTRFEYDYSGSGDDAENAPTGFIGLQTVVNTDVNGLGFTTLDGGFRYVNPNDDFSGTYSYNLTTDPRFAPAIAAFQAGQGSYFQIFVIQQANGLSTIRYDDVRLETIPEPASLALLGIGGLAMLRRRK